MSEKFKKISTVQSDDNSDSSDEEVPESNQYEDHNMIRIGVIADTEVTVGLLLTGIGYAREGFRNYLIANSATALDDLETFFYTLYRRPCIGLILIDYPTAKRLHHVLDKCKSLLPIIVIVPSKGCIAPYLEEKERQRRQRQREAYT